MVMRAEEADPGAKFAAPDSQPRQIAVYRKYVRLQAIAAARFGGSLAGKLIACVGFGQAGAELALATTIAGGAFLGIEPEQHRLKEAVHNGSCDFLVNTLDEALRVLKNEIRKRQPLSAGLLGNPVEILPAMLERGVQPDLVADTAEVGTPQPDGGDSANCGNYDAHFVTRGAIPLETRPHEQSNTDSSESGESAAFPIVWSAANLPDLRRMDRKALEWLPSEDQLRRRWLEQAGARFYRQKPLERVLTVSKAELPVLVAELKAAGPWSGPAAARWRDSGGTRRSIHF